MSTRIKYFDISLDTSKHIPVPMQTKFAGNSISHFWSGTPYPGSPNKTDPSHFRDCAADDHGWLTRAKALKVPRLGYLVGSHNVNYVDPDENGRGKGHEYNIDFFNYSNDQKYFDQGNLIGYDGGSGEINWKSSFITEFKRIIGALNVPGDVAFNIKHCNMAQLQYLVDQINPGFIQFGNESNTENGNKWPTSNDGIWDGNDYRDLANTAIDYLIAHNITAEPVLDCGLMYKNSPKNDAWQAIMATINRAKYGRTYCQPSDEIIPDSDQNGNLARMITYFDPHAVDFNTTTGKSTIISFQNNILKWKWLFQNNAYGQYLRMFLSEYLTEDNRGKGFFVKNYPVGMLGMGLAYQSFLRNTSDIAYVGIMQYGAMIGNIDTDRDNEYYQTKQLSPLMYLENVMELDITNMPGVTGIGGNKGSDYYYLITNTSQTDYQPKTGLNNRKQILFQRDTMYCDALSQRQSDVNFDNGISESILNIPALSNNVIKVAGPVAVS